MGINRRHFISAIAAVCTLRAQAATVDDSGGTTGPPVNAGTAPSIVFTFVPPRGAYQHLQGRVLHADPVTHVLSVAIFVGGWWTKPTFAQPTVALRGDGTWSANITTGGNDPDATAIAAFLVPVGFPPPLLAGDATLPASLERAAVARLLVQR